jgi:hypothetical protein
MHNCPYSEPDSSVENSGGNCDRKNYNYELLRFFAPAGHLFLNFESKRERYPADSRFQGVQVLAITIDRANHQVD